MTCIIGLAEGGKVYIGADSAGVAGQDVQIRKDKKVCINNGFAMGFTTSFRMGQLIEFGFSPPPPPEAPRALMKFMVVDFVNALRTCLKDGGFASKTNEAEQGGTFLVGIKGRLFEIYGDYQVAESVYGMSSVGGGFQYALGALCALSHLKPKLRIIKALEIVEKWNTGVRGPFHVVSV